MENDAFQSRVLQSLTRLETHMTDLVGNGQPGRIANLETRVLALDDLIETLRRKQSWYIGAMIGAGTAVSAIIHFVFHY